MIEETQAQQSESQLQGESRKADRSLSKIWRHLIGAGATLAFWRPNSRRCSRRAQFFFALWVLFLVLVAAGIHGSSIAFAIQEWSPGSHYSGYLLPRIADKLGGLNVGALGNLALSTPRIDRSDEWIKNTPPALGQFNHDPKFPVVNTNIGDGQNMLAWMPNTPVWHLTALARPATWGYFFLGPQR